MKSQNQLKQSKKSDFFKGTKSTFFTTTRNQSSQNYPDRRKRPAPITLGHFNYKRAPPKDFEVTALTGKGKKRVPSQSFKESTEEIKYGHKRNVSSLSYLSSNSKRTICPYLNTEPIKQIKTRDISNKDSKEFSYISLIDLYSNNKKKKTNPRCYQSQCFDYNSKPIKEHFYKGVHTPYQKFTSTTQIYNLPGGTKRHQNDILDDTLPVKKNRRSKSFQLKTKNEYNSNVSCLPGVKINPIHHIYRRYSARKNQSSIERSAERDEEISRALTLSENERTISPYSSYRSLKTIPAGCYNTKDSNIGKGKRFVNLSQWKNNYYRKLKKLFNHVNPGDGRTTCKKSYGIYKNKSHFKIGNYGNN